MIHFFIALWFARQTEQKVFGLIIAKRLTVW